MKNNIYLLVGGLLLSGTVFADWELQVDRGINGSGRSFISVKYTRPVAEPSVRVACDSVVRQQEGNYLGRVGSFHTAPGEWTGGSVVFRVWDVLECQDDPAQYWVTKIKIIIYSELTTIAEYELRY